MTDDEINGVVSELLRKRFADAGFDRSTVETEEDFDGSFILRVTAHFREGNLPSEQMIDALHDIRSELINRGEDRFVFLDWTFPHEELVDEDEE